MFALDQQLTEEQRLYRCLTQVLDHDRYAAMAGAVQLGVVGIEDGFPTAYTDGRNIYFGREFIRTLEDAEIRGLVIHELYHIVRLHFPHLMWMWETDHNLANRTWDEVINNLITEENRDDGFARLPEGGCCSPEFKGKTEVEVWNILYEEKQKEEGESGDGESGENSEDDSGDSQGGGNPEDEGFDQHGVEEYRKLSDADKKQLEEETVEAIRQGLLASEKSGKGVNQSIADLVEVVIPWEDILQEWVTTMFGVGEDATYRKPNKKYLHLDIIRPTPIKDKLEDLALLIDASGSCCQPDTLAKFLSVVKSILDSVDVNKVHLLFWDTEVRQHEVYGEGHAPVSELVNTTLTQGATGGGGTRPSCLPDYMAQHNIKPEGAIVLTDGYISGGWGDGQWDCSVLWAILNNKRATPTNNKKVDVTI